MPTKYAHRLLDVDSQKVAQICQRYGIKKLYLFGSVGRGEADADSDIDLVAQFGPAESRFKQYMGAQIALEDLLKRKVALVGFEGIKKKPYFAEQIHKEKVLLYAS